ncbi:MAG: F0F1 ATP synthase subunit epsilon [Winogradskyella sp.]|nr:F0F1 ATP synthase subunit epsilon [Winogradskyella sp.]MBT8377258.1 F0F1 ATP synthase subunit epsilon [Bacteroidia bacterium]NNC46105.1 F0F1 ATP synthase subunit epsilon [Winogradskyella sp.]NNF86842.1 F0F1 ATP synthase subunit epsilon [Winogradskyella sp.]NNL83390.1 F0F1 ATP synthase subunit epsilon [Winogradskyella sp.]
MHLEIVSPEATLFSSEVDSVVVPGVNGEFEMLKDHAPIVSILKEGTVRINTHSQNQLELDELHAAVIPHKNDKKVLTVAIKSGTIEMKDNKVIVLAD